MESSRSFQQKVKRVKFNINHQDQNTDPQTFNENQNEILKKLDILTETTINVQRQIDVLQDQMKLSFKALAENKVLISKCLRQTHEDESVSTVFPILNIEKLIELENSINNDNKKQYIKAVRTLLEPAGVQKKLRHILSDDLMMAYNVDGVQGKRRLKDHENFYGILQEAVSMTNANSLGPAKDHIRKALQMQKRRVFKNKSLAKKHTIESNLKN